MAISRGPKLVTNGLVLALDASDDNSFAAQNLPIKNGLILWLDAADDDSFVYSSGTVVSQWRDKSGLNNHVAQSTVANQPSRSSTLNSRKIIVFDGSNDSLSSANSLDLSTTHTIFAIASQSVGSSDAGLVSINNTLNNGMTLHNASTYYAYFGDGSKYVSYGIGASTYYIFTKVFKGSSSTTRQIYLNGTSATTSGTITASDTTGVIRLGQQSTYLNGTIAEVIIFNRELSATEIKQVHTYLGQKWGIVNTDKSSIDLSGNNNNGLLGNGATANMPVYDFYNKGGLKFDGSNDYVSVGANASLQSNNVSIGIFFKTINNGQAVQFMGGYGNTGNYGYWIGTAGTDLRFKVGNGITALQLTSGIVPNNDQIYYVVGTYDGASQKIYVDGVLKATGTTVTGNMSYTGMTDGFLLGQVQGFTASRYMTGNIYHTHVYNRALSAAEVSQNYEAIKSRFANTIIQQGLILNLDAGNNYSYAGSGTTWYDVSGNGYNGTLTSSPVYSTDSGGAFKFSGNYSLSPASTVNSLNGDALTVEAWIKHDSFGVAGTGRSYVSNWHSFNTLNQRGFILRTYGADTYPRFWWCWGGGNNYDAFGPSSYVMQTGKIYHIVATYEKNVAVKIYINGNLEGTGTNSITNTIAFDTTNGVYIGFSNINNSYMDGNIYSARLYNRVLTADQVLQNYNALKGRFGL